jgi:hypothetical protein
VTWPKIVGTVPLIISINRYFFAKAKMTPPTTSCDFVILKG